VRIYVPATSTVLRALLADGALPTGQTAFAVTPGLREWYRDDDIEELEYAALLEAARASLRFLDDDRSAARRRIVVAADLADSLVAVRDDIDRGVVRLEGTVPVDRVASVHVDDRDAEDAVAAAAAAIAEADLGSATAQDAVDDAEGFDLQWYATQEIGALLESL
jgi:hypothetical protein